MKTSIFIIQVLPNGTSKQLCKLGNGQQYEDLATALKTGKITHLNQTEQDNGSIILTIVVDG